MSYSEVGLALPPEGRSSQGFYVFRYVIPWKEADSHYADREQERKQRLREYRIAARREKRNRKSDEKKQRKLNATILRRMVHYARTLCSSTD